jgi:hypothetical protein
MLDRITLLLPLLLALAVGCEDCSREHPCCEDGSWCGCPYGVKYCDLSCGDGCELDCATGDGCDLSCGSDCVIDCTDMPDCESSCGDNCEVHCSSISSCNVEVGEGSTVVCENAGQCNIECLGSCSVEASSVGSAEISCRQSDGTSVAAPQCDATHWACGGC